MITVKPWGRLLALLLLCAFLCACSKADFSDSPLEQLRSELTDQGETKNYRMILPSDATSEVAQAAHDLADAIEEKIDGSVTVFYEHEIEKSDENDVFFLIGWTQQSSAQMQELKAGDYLCRMNSDGSIVLGGRSEAATLIALERFEKEILPAARANVLMHTEAGFLYRAASSDGSVMLNGFDLQSYSVVCDEKTEALASALCRCLEEEIGYSLALVSEQNFPSQGKGICLRLDDAAEDRQGASLSPDGNGVLLSASDSYGLSVAARAFLNLLANACLTEEKNCVLEQTQLIEYETFAGTIASVSAEPLFSATNVSQFYAVTDAILSENPDWTVLGRMPASVAWYLSDSLPTHTITYTRSGDNVNLLLSASNEKTPVLLEEKNLSSNESLNATLWQLGDEQNGLRLLHIRGTLSENTSIALSECLPENQSADLVVVHVCTNGFTLSVTEAQEMELDAVSQETYTAQAVTRSFAVYVDSDRFSVEIVGKADEAGYRELSFERLAVVDGLTSEQDGAHSDP